MNVTDMTVTIINWALDAVGPGEAGRTGMQSYNRGYPSVPLWTGTENQLTDPTPKHTVPTVEVNRVECA